MTNNINYPALKSLLKSKGTIVVDDILVKKILGYDDVRDFFQAIGNWAYNSDFTYQGSLTSNTQKFIRAFLKSYLD